MKALLIICDGMGDRLTNGKTPLEAAKKPNFDRIARDGVTGLVHTVAPGVAPGSDTSHLALFGYDPCECYKGRGPLEALGENVKLEKGDVAIRGNFATVEGGVIKDRRAGRDEYGLDELAKSLDGMLIDDVKVIFRKATGHRAIVVFRGKGLSAKVSDTDPEEVGSHIKSSIALDNSQEAKRTAMIVNKFTEKACKILDGHKANKERVKMGQLPANAVLGRSAGISEPVVPFGEKYGIRAAAVAGVTLVKGVCRSVGMDMISVEGANGHRDTNLKGKADAALKALDDHDFVFLHIKGTDEVSHDGDFEGKKRMIERIDKEVLEKILKKADLKNTTIIVTADHSTPIGLKRHSADPVPIAILGDVLTDDVKKFDERSCAKGYLGHIMGRDMMNMILDLTDHSKLFGG